MDIDVGSVSKNIMIDIRITCIKKFSFLLSFGIWIIKLGAKLLPLESKVYIDLVENKD